MRYRSPYFSLLQLLLRCSPLLLLQLILPSPTLAPVPRCGPLIIINKVDFVCYLQNNLQPPFRYQMLWVSYLILIHSSRSHLASMGVPCRHWGIQLCNWSELDYFSKGWRLRVCFWWSSWAGWPPSSISQRPIGQTQPTWGGILLGYCIFIALDSCQFQYSHSSLQGVYIFICEEFNIDIAICRVFMSSTKLLQELQAGSVVKETSRSSVN